MSQTPHPDHRQCEDTKPKSLLSTLELPTLRNEVPAEAAVRDGDRLGDCGVKAEIDIPDTLRTAGPRKSPQTFPGRLSTQSVAPLPPPPVTLPAERIPMIQRVSGLDWNLRFSHEKNVKVISDKTQDFKKQGESA